MNGKFVPERDCVRIEGGVKLCRVGAHLLELYRVSAPAVNRVTYNHWSIPTVNEFVDKFV